MIERDRMKLNLKEKVFRSDEKPIWLLIVAYTIILSVLTSLKHYCFRSYTFDLGIWTQVFWHTLRGNFMYSMPRWGPPVHPINVLGTHISPLVILLLPIYYVFSSPYTLLVLQSFVLALPALYLYRIAKIKESKRTSIIIALIYLVSPATLWPNWYDFHPQAFVPLFVSMAYYYYHLRDDKKIFLSLFLLLSVGEYTPFIVLSFIVYILVKESKKPVREYLNENRKRLLNLAILTSISVTYFVLCQLIKKSVFPERDLYFRMEILESITFTNLMYKLAYILMLFGPLLFLPFLSSVELIPALPFLGFAMLTGHHTYFEITWQYPVLVSIPIFIALIYSLPKIQAKIQAKHIRKKLIFASICFLVFLSPISPIMATLNPDWGVHIPDERIFLMHNALSSIEPNATVLAQENIFPHLAERKIAFSVWPPVSVMEPPDYIVVDLTDTYWYHNPKENPIDKQLYALTENYTYGITASISGFLVLKHNYVGAPKIFSPLKTVVKPNQLNINPNRYKPKLIRLVDSSSNIYIPITFTGFAWTGPRLHLPPGKYVIKFSMKIDQQVQDDPVLKVDAISWQNVWWKHTTHVEKVIYYGDNLNVGSWSIVEMEFQSDKIISNLEVRGRAYGVKTDIWVSQIEIIQVNL